MRIVGMAVALLLVALWAALFFAQRRWQTRTSELLAAITNGSPEEEFRTFSVSDIDSLPGPVQRYLRAVLRDGQPLVRNARFLQEGELLLKPEEDGWGPFKATQHVSSAPPGFLWDARIRMAPGLSVMVRDGFVDGAGSMVASVMGLFNVVSAEGTPGLAAGALHRYLAEAVWCPTSLLPSQGVKWNPIDDSTARATLSAGGTTVSLDFRFSDDGLVESIFTPERARDVDGEPVPTPWQGRFWDYEDRDGMRIPLSGEVEWLLPEGPQVYWRGRITDVLFQPNSGI